LILAIKIGFAWYKDMNYNKKHYVELIENLTLLVLYFISVFYGFYIAKIYTNEDSSIHKTILYLVTFFISIYIIAKCVVAAKKFIDEQKGC